MKDPRVYSVWSSKQQEGLYFVILRKYYFSSTYNPQQPEELLQLSLP